MSPDRWDMRCRYNFIRAQQSSKNVKRTFFFVIHYFVVVSSTFDSRIMSEQGINKNDFGLPILSVSLVTFK